MERPRFHNKAVVPEVPEGMQLVKFHGEPALIRARKPGDPIYGNSRNTITEAEDLKKLERERLSIERIVKQTGGF
jgi:hypothetical protein